MPQNYKTTAYLQDSASGMIWTLSTYHVANDPADILPLWEAFWLKYKVVCANTVRWKSLRISDVALYRDITIYSGDFSDPGDEDPPTTEIGTYLHLQGNGTASFQGFSIWKLHGIAASLTSGSFYDGPDNALSDLRDAAQVYFNQYRVPGTARLPTTFAPVSFANFVITKNLYFRRLGRPLFLPGQQRAYRRRPAAV